MCKKICFYVFSGIQEHLHAVRNIISARFHLTDAAPPGLFYDASSGGLFLQGRFRTAGAVSAVACSFDEG